MLQNDPASESLTSTVMVIGQPMEQAPETKVPASPAKGETTPDSAKNSEYVSGAAKARKIGESRRKLARALLETATKSEVGASALKTQLESDPSTAKYLRENWPKEYNQVVSGEKTNEPLDEVTIKMQAKAELLAEQLQEDRENEIEEYAANLSFTAIEAEQLKDLVRQLEGKKIGDKILSLEEAIQKASTVIRPDKAKFSNLNLPQGTTPIMVTATEQEVQNERIAAVRKKYIGGDMDKIKKNLSTVEKNMKDGIFVVPMD